MPNLQLENTSGIALKNCLERRAVIYTRRENQAGECGLGLPPHPLRPHQKAFRCPQGGLGQAGGQCACAAISIFLKEMKRPGAITHAQQLEQFLNRLKARVNTLAQQLVPY